MPAVRVWNVDRLANRYASVRLSRLVLRGLAASTVVAGVLPVAIVVMAAVLGRYTIDVQHAPGGDAGPLWFLSRGALVIQRRIAAHRFCGLNERR